MVLNILNISKYAFHRVLNKPPVLNIPGLGGLWQGSGHGRATQGAEYA